MQSDQMVLHFLKHDAVAKDADADVGALNFVANTGYRRIQMRVQMSLLHGAHASRERGALVSNFLWGMCLWGQGSRVRLRIDSLAPCHCNQFINQG